MDVVFDFEFGGNGHFGKVYRPVAQVDFKSPNLDRWTTSWMVVDTGADFSILPKYISRDLGISLEKECIVDQTLGVGGEQTIYLMKDKVLAKIGDVSRKVPLAFFDSDEIPALLGRLGFLETFDVEFLRNHKVVFKD